MSDADTLAALASGHSVPGAATWIAGPGGLPALDISTPRCRALVYAHGGHVATWQPAGHDPVLFMSPKSAFAPGKAIRGGVPVCFPWFGPKHDDPKAPAHGFARSRAWSVEGVALEPSGDVRVELVLTADAATRAVWPAEFEVRHIVRLGAALSMTIECWNRGTAPFDMEAALHTYFAVGDVERARIEGLAATELIDKVANFARSRSGDGAVGLTGDTDRIYLGTRATTTIDDPVLGRRIRIEKAGSTSTVVWNPWATKAAAMGDLGAEVWNRFLCVETCNVRPAPVSVAPGTAHAMQALVSVTRTSA